MTHSKDHHTSATRYMERLASVLVGMEAGDETGKVLLLDDATAKAVAMLRDVTGGNKKVLIIGNGGSAAIASHVQNDLVKAVGVRALVFNEPALLTALANDHGYATVFARPVELWAEPEDLLIAISSSGKSESILSAVRVMRERGGHVITLSGFGAANPLRSAGHLNFYAPAGDYGAVEMAHACLLHCITDQACAAKRGA